MTKAMAAVLVLTVVAAKAPAQTVDEIVAATGSSRETVRSQMKRVFAKTGVNRQADLVRLVLLGSAVLMYSVSALAGLPGRLQLVILFGCAVAMLAGLSPLGVVPAALFVAGVFVGADTMSRSIGVSNYLADLVVALTRLP